MVIVRTMFLRSKSHVLCRQPRLWEAVVGHPTTHGLLFEEA